MLLLLLLLAAPKPDDLVVIEPGDIPIILSVPHSGTRPVSGIEPRKNDGTADFTTVRDVNTHQLARKLQAALEKRLGGKPYVVIARFDRKYIDANRPATRAYDQPQSKPHYDAYHQALADARADVLKRWGTGLLLDVHGQSAEVDAIFRGTSQLKTVAALRQRAGDAALTGPESLFGQLQKKGYRVIPDPGATDQKEPRFSGGHIIRAHGSHNERGIDAIQLEFGSKLRARDRLDQTADDVADAVAAFAKKYLPAKEKK